MSLCALLQTLALEDTAPPDRERAATELYRELRRWGGGVVRRRLPSAPQVVVEEAIHKVVLKASLGRSRFRGSDDRAARAWCNRILQRHVIDYFRRKKRHVVLDDAPPPRTARQADPVVEEDLSSLFERLEDALARMHRPRDLERVRQNLRVHLEARVLGSTIDEQIERWADPGEDASRTDQRRARDRIYQYRRRGKVAACQSVAALLDTAEMTAVEADLMVRILGCDEEEG